MTPAEYRQAGDEGGRLIHWESIGKQESPGAKPGAFGFLSLQVPNAFTQEGEESRSEQEKRDQCQRDRPAENRHIPGIMGWRQMIISGKIPGAVADPVESECDQGARYQCEDP